MLNDGSAPLETDIHRLSGQYGELFPRVYNYARFRLKDPVAADEVAACTFEKAFEKIATYDPERGSLAVWILAIARNAVIDHLRWVKRGRRFSMPISDDIPDSLYQPEQETIISETRAELLEALSRLSEREREIISLKFSGRLTNREIAAVTGMSDTNVGVTLFRAVRRLKRLLENMR